MLLREFEELTGFYPSDEMFAEIHKEYLKMECDKKTFCERYKRNKNGLASIIQYHANVSSMQSRQSMNAGIELLNTEIETLKSKLDKELNWVPYFSENMLSQDDYSELSSKMALVTEDYARHFIEDTFGFNYESVCIISKFPVEEINKYKKIRSVENKYIDRRPLYDSTDFNYILFECRGILYECRDGDLKIV